MTAPYQLPADLFTQPLGISWSTMGSPTSLKPSPDQNTAAVEQIARQASSEADGEAGQLLRAMVNTETNYAPGHRCGLLPNGLARFITSRNPVLRVVNAQVAPANQLPNTTWTQLPPGCAYPEEEPIGVYNSSAPGGAHGGSQAVLISGSWVNWGLGRMGTRVQLQYLAGWPHTQLTAPAAVGDDALLVDEVAAWAGAVGLISDGGDSEVVSVGTVSANLAPPYNAAALYATGTYVSVSGADYCCLVTNGPGTATGAVTPGTNATVWQANPEPAGPGTLTLTSPIQNPHSEPVLVTATPSSLRWAVALYAKAMALERGVATMTIGTNEAGGGGGLEAAIAGARMDAAIIIRDLARIY